MCSFISHLKCILNAEKNRTLIKSAMSIANIEPFTLSAILVYHSGEKKYTAETENKTGKVNTIAIGNPRIILLFQLLYSTLTLSQ